MSTKNVTVKRQSFFEQKKRYNVLNQMAHKFKDVLGHHLKKANEAWLSLAKVLHTIRDEKLYKVKYRGFREYIENEIDIGRAQVYNYISVDTAIINNILSEEEALKMGQKKAIEFVRQKSVYQVDTFDKKQIVEDTNTLLECKKTLRHLIRESYGLSKDEQISWLEQALTTVIRTNNDEEFLYGICQHLVPRMKKLFNSIKSQVKNF